MSRTGNAERLSRQLALLGRGERRLWRVLPHGYTKVVVPISAENGGVSMLKFYRGNLWIRTYSCQM